MTHRDSDDDAIRTEEEGHLERETSTGEQAEEVGRATQEKASEVGDRAQEEADARREQAAEGIQSAAEKVRERAEGQGGPAGKLGMQVAEGMDSTAGYLESRSTSEIWADVENYARRHPGPAVAGAVLAGLIIGKLLR